MGATRPATALDAAAEGLLDPDRGRTQPTERRDLPLTSSSRSRTQSPSFPFDARLSGTGKAVHGAIWRADPDVVARHRAEGPQLWEAVDSLRTTLGRVIRRVLRLTGTGTAEDRRHAEKGRPERTTWPSK